MVLDNKLKLLVFVRHYLPGYQSGGPVRTIANMVHHLGDEFEISIVTSDRDALDKTPYQNVDAGKWARVGKAAVLYIGPGRRSVNALARIIRETQHDVLYLNSYFDFVFSLKPLLARYFGMAPRKPCVIAPRGEFSEGALALKRWKKRPYLLLAHLLGLHRGLMWQASSEREKRDIMHGLGGHAGLIRVAPNLPTVNAGGVLNRASGREPGSRLKVCFLSRISPMKNLDFAIQVLLQVRAQVEFNIYGPVRDEGYWNRCKHLLESLPESIEARYRGSVHPDQVAGTIAQHDLFFLPTRGENYGHVIAEALCSGTPVLIANTTPWRHLEENGVGWDLDLHSTESFARCIDYCFSLEAEKYMVWRERVRTYAAKRLFNDAVIDQNRRLFIEAAAMGDAAGTKTCGVSGYRNKRE